MRVNNIFSVAEEFLQYNAPGKLLITPPETQGFTKQGIGTAQSTQPFKADGAWVINQNVDDEKLARILTLFNDMAFDPETYVNMVYGIEGTHFNWSGQPYESKIVPIKNVYAPLILEGIQVFHTGIVDGKAGKREYNYDPNPVFDYINSYSAEQLNLWPYKEDYKGVLAAEKAALDDQYGETLREIVNTYYQRALEGVGEVASTWESYIAALHEAGLDDYIALYERY